MVLIEWRQEFCTGINGVDFEHEQLINRINAVYALIEGKADKQLVVDGLGDIYGSISAHFALEERTMRNHDYDHYKVHKADHERLLDEIGDITDDFENSNELDALVFKQKLANWFQVHFKTHDSRLHTLAKLPQHEAVDGKTLKTLIQNAKNKLLGRSGQQR